MTHAKLEQAEEKNQEDYVEMENEGEHVEWKRILSDKEIADWMLWPYTEIRSNLLLGWS